MGPAHVSSASHESNQTSFFAKPHFIQAQRLTAVALFALGCLASTFAPATSGASMAAAYPLMHLGTALVGASLIQQVIGDAPGCTEGKVKRIIAGALMILGGPLGTLVGAFFWHASNEDNMRSRLL